MELLMVTKNKEIGRGFRNKFGMTGGQFGMTSLKFGMLLLLVLFFNSCSFYEELRNTPRLKDGVIKAPESFTGIKQESNNGIITLEWSPVEGAEKYEIFCYDYAGSNFKEQGDLIYTFKASNVKNNTPKLEISNLLNYKYYNFFVRAVSEKGITSIFCKQYVHVDYGYTGNSSGELVFREL